MASEIDELDLDLDDEMEETLRELTSEEEVESTSPLEPPVDTEVVDEEELEDETRPSLLPKIVAGATAFVVVMGAFGYGAFHYMTSEELPQVVTAEVEQRPPSVAPEQQPTPPSLSQTTSDQRGINVDTSSVELGGGGLDLGALPFADDATDVGVITDPSETASMKAATVSALADQGSVALSSDIEDNGITVAPGQSNAPTLSEAVVDASVVEKLQTELEALRSQNVAADNEITRLNSSLSNAKTALVASKQAQEQANGRQQELTTRIAALTADVAARDKTILALQRSGQVASVLDKRVRLGRFYIVSDQAIPFKTQGKQKRAVIAIAPSGRTVTLFAGELVKLGNTRLEVKEVAQDGSYVVVGSKWFIDKKDVDFSQGEIAMRDRIRNNKRKTQTVATTANSTAVIIGAPEDVQAGRSKPLEGFEKGRDGYQFIGHMRGGDDNALHAVITTPSEQRVVKLNDVVSGLGKVAQLSESHVVIGNVYFSKVSL